MTTTTKCLLAGMTLTICGSALATVTPANTTNTPSSLVGATAHSITVAVATPSTPLTFVDGNVSSAAKAGETLRKGDIITSSSFATTEGHKYVLAPESGDALTDHVKFSFSDSASELKGTDYQWLTSTVGAGNAYVLISKDDADALTPGLHNYTFVVSDYNS
ncbi:hypothetical protein [Salmonella enterica]|uniref:Uncharacterized protein n=1 Tax=Salmonella enterica I TaxID=59201 RepID=A0A7Z1PGG4_SALET|nr:hypothetical protein [Salmonella enterica]PTU36269.1 hypothetical protein DBZ43_14585 [Salmonella enterica subsp. enterica]